VGSDVWVPPFIVLVLKRFLFCFCVLCFVFSLQQTFVKGRESSIMVSKTFTKGTLRINPAKSFGSMLQVAAALDWKGKPF